MRAAVQRRERWDVDRPVSTTPSMAFDELACRRRVRHVLALAHEIEPDAVAVNSWWRHDAIAALDNLTAAELCRRGRVVDLEDFLRHVLCDDAGGRWFSAR